MNGNILQQLDQFQSYLRDLAPVLWSYKEHLKKQGFTDNQAFKMALEIQKSLFNANKDGGQQ